VEREITLREYGRVVWSGRWVILACALAAALVALLFSLLSTTTYTATAEVTLGQATTIAGTPVSTPATNPATAATVLGADRLVVNVAEKLDLTPGEVRSAVSLSAPRTAGGAAGNQPTLIVVTWKDTDADLAERGANAYTEEIERFMLDTNSAVVDTYESSVARAKADVVRLNAQVDAYSRQLLANPSTDTRLTLTTLLAAATSQLSQAQVQLADQQVALAKAQTIEQPDIISLAEDSTSSAGARNLARTMLLGAVIGAILGVIITFIWRGSPAGRAGRQDS
jgi:capsular polysaccharide biosynthesis protein